MKLDDLGEHCMGILCRLKQPGNEQRLKHSEKLSCSLKPHAFLLPPPRARPKLSPPLYKHCVDRPNRGNQVGQLLLCVTETTPIPDMLFRDVDRAVFDLRHHRIVPPCIRRERSARQATIFADVAKPGTKCLT